MLDRLEKGSGQSVVTLQEAKSLLKEDDDLIIAVYDYWLEKRLKTVCINCIFLANYQYDLEAILRNVTLFLSNGH